MKRRKATYNNPTNAYDSRKKIKAAPQQQQQPSLSIPLPQPHPPSSPASSSATVQNTNTNANLNLNTNTKTKPYQLGGRGVNGSKWRRQSASLRQLYIAAKQHAVVQTTNERGQLPDHEDENRNRWHARSSKVSKKVYEPLLEEGYLKLEQRVSKSESELQSLQKYVAELESSNMKLKRIVADTHNCLNCLFSCKRKEREKHYHEQEKPEQEPHEQHHHWQLHGHQHQQEYQQRQQQRQQHRQQQPHQQQGHQQGHQQLQQQQLQHLHQQQQHRRKQQSLQSERYSLYSQGHHQQQKQQQYQAGDIGGVNAQRVNKFVAPAECGLTNFTSDPECNHDGCGREVEQHEERSEDIIKAACSPTSVSGMELLAASGRSEMGPVDIEESVRDIGISSAEDRGEGEEEGKKGVCNEEDVLGMEDLDFDTSEVDVTRMFENGGEDSEFLDDF